MSSTSTGRGPAGSPWQSLLEVGSEPDLAEPDEFALLDGVAQAGLLADLDQPGLVLSAGYIGADRRTAGLRARVHRATFGQRRALVRLEFVVVAVVVVLMAASILMLGSVDRARTVADRSAAPSSVDARSLSPLIAAPAGVPAATAPATTGAATTVPTTGPASVSKSAPAPASSVAPAPAVAPAAAPAPVTTPTVSIAPATPAQLGAQALTLVRYPWQNIPGYSIEFLPISDAPSPGFYGNTTFTWGRAGGVSSLYVFPGETVQQLAGIIAFEIGHEVDAAAVEPEGGQAQIENILGIHPASWAPDCDCAEQGFLSGWYAAAFSNYWSPGVGNWSQVAPEPSGAVLAAVEPWLSPTLP